MPVVFLPYRSLLFCLFVSIGDLPIVILGVHLGENLFDAPLGVDDEGRAQHAHVLAAVHRLFGPDAERFANAVVGVGQQREVQFVFGAEIPVRTFAVGADADDPEPHGRQFGLAVAQALGFERASRSVVLGIEIEYRALSHEVGLRKGLAVLRHGGEIGGRIPHSERRHFFVMRINCSRRCQRYGKSSAEASVSLVMPGRSI